MPALATATLACCLVSAACFAGVLTTSEMPIEEQKQLLENWQTPLYLVFCPHGNHTAHLFFRPPPVPPSVRLTLLEVLILSPGRHEPVDMVLIHNPNYLGPIRNGSDLVHYATSSMKFRCANSHDCQGLYAELRGVSFSDYFTCLHCEKSGTKDGCIYFSNGTTLSSQQQQQSKQVNCSNPPELEDYANCQETREQHRQREREAVLHQARSAGWIALLVLGVVAACVLLAAVALLCTLVARWKRRAGTSEGNIYYAIQTLSEEVTSNI